MAKTKAKATEATETTQAPAAAAAPAPAPVVKDQQHGVTRPKAGTTTGRIWEITDAQSKALGKPAPRKDVIAQAKSEGINEATAATQYGRWRKYFGLASEPKAPAAPKAAAAPQAAASGDVTVEAAE